MTKKNRNILWHWKSSEVWVWVGCQNQWFQSRIREAPIFRDSSLSLYVTKHQLLAVLCYSWRYLTRRKCTESKVRPNSWKATGVTTRKLSLSESEPLIQPLETKSQKTTYSLCLPMMSPPGWRGLGWGMVIPPIPLSRSLCMNPLPLNRVIFKIQTIAVGP